MTPTESTKPSSEPFRISVVFSSLSEMGGPSWPSTLLLNYITNSYGLWVQGCGEVTGRFASVTPTGKQ